MKSSPRTVVGVGLLLLAPGAGAAGQLMEEGHGTVFRTDAPERSVSLGEPLVDVSERYVVVHVEENRVFLMDGGEAVWSAPAGTGTGFRLEGQGRKWTFTTPRGLFRIKRKEKDPLWIPPDWYYVEKGIPIPKGDRRGLPGVMGTTAIYLGDGIAIHGTNSPSRLLDPDPERRRISHGCIRLTNEAARALYHMVDVGMPVLVY